MNRIIKSIAIGLLSAIPCLAHADIIDQYRPTDAYQTGTAEAYFGQLVHNDSAFTYDTITFNFYADMYATFPTVAGTAYLLDRPYHGTPENLNASTPGVFGVSTGLSGGVYNFAPGVEIQPYSNYYVYTDTEQTIGDGAQQGDMDYPLFSSASAGSNFGEVGASATLFQLDGTAVPEPATSLLVAFGGLSLLGVRRARSKRR